MATEAEPSPSASATAALPPAAASSLCLVYAGVYACGALYLGPSALAWRRLWRNRSRDATAVRLYALLGAGTLLRATMFLLVAAWMFLVFRSHTLGALQAQQAELLHMSYLQLVFLWQLLGMLATSVLGGVFLLVFSTWASMVERVDGDEGGSGASNHGRRRRLRSPLSAAAPPSPPRLLFIKMAAAVALLQLGAFFFLQPDPSNSARRSLLLATTVVLACCWAAAVVLLPAYGSRMCALLGKVAEDAGHRQRNVRRIAAIATVFCLLRTASLLLLAGAQYGDQDVAAAASSSSSSSSASASTSSTAAAAGFYTSYSSYSSSSELNSLTGLETRSAAIATLVPDSVRRYRIPVHAIIDANPAFFFSSPSSPSSPSSLPCDGSSCSWLRWLVMLEVAEFPLEWALLMALLCVLPSRAMLPSIRGYQPIPDKPWRA